VSRLLRVRPITIGLCLGWLVVLWWARGLYSWDCTDGRCADAGDETWLWYALATVLLFGLATPVAFGRRPEMSARFVAGVFLRIAIGLAVGLFAAWLVIFGIVGLTLTTD
jgi:hypothetical protein